MKLALWKLLVLMKTCVMFAVMVNASRPHVHCNLTESSTQDNFTNCTAFYSDDVLLVLEADDNITTNVLWYKEGHSDPIKIGPNVSLPLNQCSKSLNNCVKYKPLTYDHDGMYYCKVVNGARYYVNLTVKAPPKLLGKFDSCEYPYHDICYQQLMAERIKTEVILTVEYFGVGNIRVEWSKNIINTKQGDCNHNITTTSNGMWHRSVMTLDTSTLCSVEGVYSANVSNEVGWNMSSISVTYDCDTFYPPPPGKLPEQHSHLLQTGARKASISCHANFGEDYSLSINLVICYAPHNKSVTSLNSTMDCSTCHLDYLSSGSTAQCNSPIAMKNTWNVTLKNEPLRKSVSGMCGNRYTTTLTMPLVIENDGGVLYCLWQLRDSSSLNESFIYENHTIDIVPSDKWYPQYIVPVLGSLIVLVPVVTCIVAFLYYKRKMRTLKKNVSERTTPSRTIHRRSSRKSLAQTCQRNYGATDIPSSDDDCLFRPKVTTKQSTSTSSSTTESVKVHPAVDAHTPLLVNYQTPVAAVLKPTEEPAPGWITEEPPLCYTDPEWDLAGGQKMDSKNV